MASTVSSPWTKPGAWALDAEEHEAELQQQQTRTENDPQNDAVAADFPSLSAAVKQQPNNKKKKKKNQTTLSLADFSSYGSHQNPSSSQSQGLTHEELMSLPTGPRQRSPEELGSGGGRLGGGFRSYGVTGENSDSNRNARFSRDSSREFAPSRADEIDDWSKTKKFSAGNSFERRERGDRGSSFFESQSKADESDSWVTNKVAVEPRRFEKRGGFDSLLRGRSESNESGYRYGGYGGSRGSADSNDWGRKIEEIVNGTEGGARPKLVLQPRTLPVVESNNNDTVSRPKGSSPFGDARPREEVLKEKGMDWKEIDEKLETVKIRNGSNEKKEAFGWRRGSGTEHNERNWQRPEAAESNGFTSESAEKAWNGHATENGHTSENGHTAENGNATETESAEGN